MHWHILLPFLPCPSQLHALENQAVGIDKQRQRDQNEDRI